MEIFSGVLLLTLVVIISTIIYSLLAKVEEVVEPIFPAAEVRPPQQFETSHARYLVLGGSGFVGTNLIKSLLNRGETDITIYDLLPPSQTSPIVKSWIESNQVKYIIGDITKPSCVEQLKNILPEYNIIYYMITIIHYWLPPTLEFFGKESTSVNVDGTNNFLEAITNMTSKFDRVSLIYVSTISVLESVGVPIRGAKELDLTYSNSPFSWYAKSKAIAERAVLEKITQQSNIKTILLRPVGLYGIDDRFQAEMIWKSRADRFPVVLRSIQDSLYIDNLIYALLVAEEKIKTQPDRFHKQSYIITDDNHRTLTEFNTKLATAYRFRNKDGENKPLLTGVKKVMPLPWWLLQLLGEVNYWIHWATRGVFIKKMGQFGLLTTASLNLLKHDYYFDITRTKEELGYYPVISEDDAILNIAAHYLSKEAGLEAKQVITPAPVEKVVKQIIREIAADDAGVQITIQVNE
eukprot:TRINITY_DN6414_c0_g1_i1.p1 TRINITY_DN6414_c0_g1~~TRINITY_DN6414_c0_g1_i1.p1  ORF type:complete len:464 (-),score=65.91 TRINITY_DN6414_c0_g1_i1:21-1412(-)